MILFFSIVILILLLAIIFWQGCLLLATLFGSPIVYAYKNAVIDSLKLAETRKGDTVVDLGCGDGRSLILAAEEFGAKGIGVDRSLFCFFKSKYNVWRAGQGKNIRIVWGSFEKIEEEIGNADVIYLYLLNSTLAQIEDWIFQAIGEETKIVSLAFWFPHHKPVKEIETYTLHKFTKARLYQK